MAREEFSVHTIIVRCMQRQIETRMSTSGSTNRGGSAVAGLVLEPTPNCPPEWKHSILAFRGKQKSATLLADFDDSRTSVHTSARFRVTGTERDFLRWLEPHPQMPGPHPGGDLLWEMWETIARSKLPVE